MKKVYSAENRMLAGYVHGILESHGIQSFLKHENLGGAVGELPPNECWPEVWVLEDRDAELAERLIRDLLADMEGATAWRCPQCRELIDGQFGQCWNCGTAAPA